MNEGIYVRKCNTFVSIQVSKEGVSGYISKTAQL